MIDLEQSSEEAIRQHLAKLNVEYTKLCAEVGNFSYQIFNIQLRQSAINQEAGQLKDHLEKKDKIDG
jgi:hypothetical protein